MKLSVPSDCGNSPRIGIVTDFAVAWAAANTEEFGEWLADDIQWTITGGATHRGPDVASQVVPPFAPERIELLSVVTHGRLASCDGFLTSADQRLDFSHAIRFASTSKVAKIAEIRTYLVT